MKYSKLKIACYAKVLAFKLASLLILLSTSSVALAEGKGEFYSDFNLRFETVEQNNPLEDADALTLRSRLGFKTGVASGFSALIEIEDVREIVDDFSVPPAGVRPGQFSVIADPEGTEVDQAFVKYATDNFSFKLGRQVFTLDGHRFVGHVGWRQDRQTFDAAVVNFKPVKGVDITAAYLDKRNRIFHDEADLDAKDVILNASYATPVGKLVAYAYLLEVDNDTDNSLDTYGISFAGKKDIFSYAAEFATQEANDTFDTDYLKLEGGITFSGITAKLGFESLGSDDGQAGFATPLATLHKFNGWADQFLGTPAAGLEDIYLSLGGKLGGGKWSVIYHDFSADESVAGDDDLGDEINLLYARKLGKGFSFGIKYADYSAGDATFGKVDTEKLWVWLNYKFSKKF